MATGLWFSITFHLLSKMCSLFSVYGLTLHYRFFLFFCLLGYVTFGSLIVSSSVSVSIYFENLL